MRLQKGLALVTVSLLAFGFAAKMQNGASSTLVVSGTSTMHAWEEKATQLTVIADVEGGQVKSVDVTVPVKGLRSHEAAMDKNTWTAMKADQFPNVTFVASKLEAGALIGKLSIAGATKDVSIPVTFANGRLAGSTKVSCAAYGVKLPVIMGFIKVGDEVTVKFDVALEAAK